MPLQDALGPELCEGMSMCGGTMVPNSPENNLLGTKGHRDRSQSPAVFLELGFYVHIFATFIFMYSAVSFSVVDSVFCADLTGRVMIRSCVKVMKIFSSERDKVSRPIPSTWADVASM